MLNARELATVLAALRYWQRDLDVDVVADGGHFTEYSPLTSSEIDLLCERLNFKATAASTGDTADLGIVICLSGGVVQAVYECEADIAVTLIDWDADIEDCDLPGVVVFEHRHCRRAAYISQLSQKLCQRIHSCTSCINATELIDQLLRLDQLLQVSRLAGGGWAAGFATTLANLAALLSGIRENSADKLSRRCDPGLAEGLGNLLRLGRGIGRLEITNRLRLVRTVL